jgi:hypothetical protein
MYGPNITVYSKTLLSLRLQTCTEKVPQLFYVGLYFINAEKGRQAGNTGWLKHVATAIHTMHLFLPAGISMFYKVLDLSAL